MQCEKRMDGSSKGMMFRVFPFSCMVAECPKEEGGVEFQVLDELLMINGLRRLPFLYVMVCVCVIEV